MKCPECGHENLTTVKFCARCGARALASPTSILRPGASSDVTEHGNTDTSIRIRSEPHGEAGRGAGLDPLGSDLTVSASQYHIVGEIGSGGIGTVYLARDKELGRFVALKRLGKTYADNAWMMERLFREARSIAALSHANIVQVYALGKDAQGPFIVMEYVPGPDAAEDGEGPNPPFSLHERIVRSGPLSHREAVTMMFDLCSAMDYAHRRGVIHRDLKPANILISESGQERIVDFGLARQWDSDEPRLTVVGTQLVSLGYGAPEQERDASTADARADVYALGGILFFLLTGENPRFFRENKVAAHLLPPILKAMAQDRNQRWQTVKEFDQALRAAVPSVTLSKVAATDSGSWRCEWCHTSNPLPSRFCSECGWDGERRCPECNAETRVGVRFCPVCGADIKQFGELTRLLSTIEANLAQKDYAMVLSQAESVRGFQARGQPGHDLLESVGRAKAVAQAALSRLEALTGQVEQAAKMGNYELVEQSVSEYDNLCDDDRFATVKEGLPLRVKEWRISNALAQARKMLSVQNWEGAERSCRKILETLDESHTEARLLLQRILRRKYAVRAGFTALLTAILAVIYGLSLFPVMRWARRTNDSQVLRAVHTVYKPVLSAYAGNGHVKAVLDRLGESVGVPVEVDGDKR